MGYCLTFDQSIELAKWLANHSYDNHILVHVNKIAGLEQHINGIYSEIWSLEYFHNTGLYEIYTDNEDTREWLRSLIEHLFNVEEIIEDD